ncbi:MAG: hypothetical protein OXM57_14470, partial [bacterium]|nr:hypothetical protein [bacterium]
GQHTTNSNIPTPENWGITLGLFGFPVISMSIVTWTSEEPSSWAELSPSEQSELTDGGGHVT